MPTFALALAITVVTSYAPLLARRETSSTTVIGVIIAAEGGGRRGSGGDLKAAGKGRPRARTGSGRNRTPLSSETTRPTWRWDTR